MGMSFVNRRLVNRYSLEILLKYASSVAALAAVAMAASVWFHVGGIALIVVLIFIFFSMNGIIAASSTAAALDAVPGNAGSASALIASAIRQRHCFVFAAGDTERWHAVDNGVDHRVVCHSRHAAGAEKIVRSPQTAS
jgi:hypothetical protein